MLRVAEKGEAVANSLTVQNTVVGIGGSIANAIKNSVNGVLDDEITLLIAMALNQLPRQLLMNSSVMVKIQRDLIKDLNTEFNKNWVVGLRKLGPGIVAGILADVAADVAEYYLVNHGVARNSARIVIAKYWVGLLIDDAVAFSYGGPYAALATTISVSVGAILDQATELVGVDSAAAASWQAAAQLSARVRRQAVLDDAQGRHEMAARLRKQADDGDRTLAQIKPTPLSVGWNPLGHSVQKPPFAVGIHRF